MLIRCEPFVDVAHPALSVATLLFCVLQGCLPTGKLAPPAFRSIPVIRRPRARHADAASLAPPRDQRLQHWRAPLVTLLPGRRQLLAQLLPALPFPNQHSWLRCAAHSRYATPIASTPRSQPAGESAPVQPPPPEARWHLARRRMQCRFPWTLPDRAASVPSRWPVM